MIIKGTVYTSTVDQGWAIVHSHIEHFCSLKCANVWLHFSSLCKNVQMCNCTFGRFLKMCDCGMALFVTSWKKQKKMWWHSCSFEMSKYAKRVQISQKLLFLHFKKSNHTIALSKRTNVQKCANKMRFPNHTFFTLRKGWSNIFKTGNCM